MKYATLPLCVFDCFSSKFRIIKFFDKWVTNRPNIWVFGYFKSRLTILSFSDILARNSEISYIIVQNLYCIVQNLKPLSFLISPTLWVFHYFYTKFGIDKFFYEIFEYVITLILQIIRYLLFVHLNSNPLSFQIL